MIAVGKVYVISSRYKYLRVHVHSDEKQNDRLIKDTLVSNMPFIVLDWSKSFNGDFYYIKALIGDYVVYFQLKPQELELITV